MSPQNVYERLFTVVIIMSSMLVVGTGISKMTNTIAEINRINAETADMKRGLLRYLKAAGVPAELSARIMRFAMHSHGRRNVMNLDPNVHSLLSVALRSELTVTQRKKCLCSHPLFAFVSEVYPEVFLPVCGAFQPHVYADRDVVFANGTWSEHVYVTLHGSFEMELEQRHPMKFHSSTWFCEVSLFSVVLHHSTLKATTFADAFTLSGDDLLQCVKRSPSCICNLYRYAQEYLGTLWEGVGCPAGKRTVNDYMPLEQAQTAVEAVQNAKASLDMTLESPATPKETLDRFLEDWHSGSLSDDEIRRQLPQVFGELNSEAGLYVKMKYEDEGKRSMSAILSAYWLLKNRYSSFTELQKPAARMSPQLWAQWQDFLKWVNMSDDMVHALMVFLAIRGLGKVKSFAKALPRDKRSPEIVVLQLMSDVPNFVPSVKHLSEPMYELIVDTLDMHSRFNLAQMLQGENTPAQVKTLQEFIRKEQEKGETLLKFYICGLICVMCALRGSETLHGSLFMDEKQGTNLLLGVKCLQRLNEARPHAVYWGFIASRAGSLGLPVDKTESLAVARLACLIRAAPTDKGMLQRAWSSLAQIERSVLSDHFLSDGVHETAFLFTFLPLYFANAKGNRSIGLYRALVVLVDLLELLHTDGYAEQMLKSTITVDLQDVASFTKEVKSPRIFLAVVGNSKLVCVGQEVQVLVTTKHWQRVNQTTWMDDPSHEMNSLLKKMERKLKALDVENHEVHDSSASMKSKLSINSKNGSNVKRL